MDEEKSRKTTKEYAKKECQGRVDFTLKRQLLHFNGFAFKTRVVYQLTDELSLAGSFHVKYDARKDAG